MPAKRSGIPFLGLTERRGVGSLHIRDVRNYVRRHQIAILHTHGYRTDVVGFLAAIGLPVATVTTHHGWIRNDGRRELEAVWRSSCAGPSTA